MTERTSKTLKRAGLVSLATLMVFGNWLLEKVEHARATPALPPVVVDNARYVPREEYDSDRRTRAQFDSSQAATLRRIDARVGEMYCGRLPAALRAGCR